MKVIIAGIAGLVVLVGLFFVLQESERQDEEIEKQKTDTQEQVIESIDDAVQKPLPDALHLGWPADLAVVYNPCANLEVPENIKQLALNLSKQKQKAEHYNKQLLSRYPEPTEMLQGNANHRAVALTIDTGVGGAGGMEQILDLGRHYGISFTFFLTGCWVLENPQLTQRLVKGGHSIANHGLTHLNLRDVSDEQARREIEESTRILREVLGWRPVLFRKPLYAGGWRTVNLLGEYNMISVQGFPDFGDTTGWRPETTAEDVTQLVKRKTLPGSIWVFHNLSIADMQALEEVIRFHIQEGYNIVSVEELLL